MSAPPPAPPPPAGPPPPGRLRLWWLLAAGLAVGLALLATNHLLRATAAFGGTLAGSALLRAVLPARIVGALAVRRRWLDVLLLLLAAAAILTAGFTLDLAPLS